MLGAIGSGGGGTGAATLRYDVTALSLTIYFNRDGDHDHNGMLFALTANVPILEYIRALASGREPSDAQRAAAEARAAVIRAPLPLTPPQAREPHPLVRPLVLRARRGEMLEVHLQNSIQDHEVGLHLVGGGYDVRSDDGSAVGLNPPSLVGTGGDRVYRWPCDNEGVFPFHDGGNWSGGEDGTNVHGLFGALIVEPEGATWRDPVSGLQSHERAGFQQLDGLYVDVLPAGSETSSPKPALESYHDWPKPEPYADFGVEAHREYVIVFHDEPEFVGSHGDLEPNPCEAGGHDHEDGHGAGGHGDGEQPPIMPISYRAEPMINRERRLWRLLRSGHVLERPVLNEEQHHSSWMFGDPETPILRAYIGDPVRIRFVHAGVKETHVFHLHLYEWHAAAGNQLSPRIDAISVSPQTGHTIEPVWGAGNRQQVAGDIIWHCHLYPHFHEGMWGLFRTFETLQDGDEEGESLAHGHDCERHGTHQAPQGDREQHGPCCSSVYAGRRIGRYPDGTLIERLLPLPDRAGPPAPTPQAPGFPLYIPGTVRQKSPRPPWPARALHPGETPPPNVTSLESRDMPPDFDYRAEPTTLERAAFNDRPVPGEIFTRNPTGAQQDAIYAFDPAADPDPDGEKQAESDRFKRNPTREVDHAVVVALRDITYNSHGWHDKHGHLYYLEADGDPATRPGPIEPLFFRARHGQIVNVTLRNATPEEIPRTEFDVAFPPCPALPWEGECATHVHMVKFDPICADGASTGWNYISGPRHGRRMVYRWWADQEFGTIFFHDHLFANLRQKHGLFGALLVEPAGSRFLDPAVPERDIVSGLQALVKRHSDDPDATSSAPGGPTSGGQPAPWFREFCVGIGDFIPMWDRSGQPLNPPAHPGGHGEQGVMGINYRSAPLRERNGDPAHWFNSRVHGDPDTTIFQTYENDPLWIRILQGSHEEQHSFQIHGLRWRRFRAQTDSTLRNQQSLGLAEAFTFINQVPFGRGDYLYKLSGIDDLWLGCWGLIRALPRPNSAAGLELLPEHPADAPVLPPPQGERRFRVTAETQQLTYRDPDIVDPFGIVYRLTATKAPGRPWRSAGEDLPPKGQVREPLVLWCREGERVVVELTNDLPDELAPEPHAPEVPVDKEPRPVSSHASMHADLVAYDVRTADGTNAGLNPPQTVAPGSTATYRWNTSLPAGETASPLGPVLLQDMADVRNHRHHGLIGALVILPTNATPHRVPANAATAPPAAPEKWHGARVTVVKPADAGGASAREEHAVLLMQDGLRLFLNGVDGGGVSFPLPDPPSEGPGEGEKEDQGQKGFNYRTEPLGPVFDPQGHSYTALREDPATPVWCVHQGAEVRLHLVGADDKPRHRSFTIHGVAWPEERFGPPAGPRPMVSSESAITAGTVRTLEFTAPSPTDADSEPRDYAYRSGVLKWDVAQGLWGLIRVVK